MTVDLKERIAAELEDVRARSLRLLEPVPEPDLVRQHSPLMSPLVWDLAHVGNYEEQWLLGALAQERCAAHLDDIYNAFAHPRRDRPALPMLDPPAARRYIGEVRGRVLDVLDRVPLDGDGAAPLLEQGFVYGMVAQHEHQHDETMLATLQLRGAYPLDEPRLEASPVAGSWAEETLVPGGSFVMGTSTDPWAYDNERPAHTVDVAPFWIDTTPVTNEAYQEFIADGGYDDARWWTADGWAWRQEAGLKAPEFWERSGGSWWRKRFGVAEAVPPRQPVQHVCWYEADAFARWAGKRLPTEAEWEKAAQGAGSSPANLWGNGRFSPAPAGSFAESASQYGVRQMIGDVWEWTASDFAPYPGFRSHPYREYSEVFFGDKYKVLRGGSWATHPLAVRTTFRNWDYPIRRQIFAGFRCARDADV